MTVCYQIDQDSWLGWLEVIAVYRLGLGIVKYTKEQFYVRYKKLFYHKDAIWYIFVSKNSRSFFMIAEITNYQFSEILVIWLPYFHFSSHRLWPSAQDIMIPKIHPSSFSKVSTPVACTQFHNFLPTFVTAAKVLRDHLRKFCISSVPTFRSFNLKSNLVNNW